MNASVNVAAPRWTSWAEQELGGAGLGDARLDARLVKLTAALLASPQGSIPKACGNWPASKAAYRFFDNPRVVFDVIIERHRTSALLRAKQEAVVLAVADTTMLDYTDHPETAGLGPLADVVHHGLLLHPTLLVTPERVPLGVIDPQMWVRDIDTFGAEESSKKKRSLEEKESQKWVISAEEAMRFQQDVGPSTRVVSVFDREGDTYDVLSWATGSAPTPIDLLVRAKVDRKVDQEAARLWEVLENTKVAQQIEITKPRKPGEKARSAVLSIRYATVVLLKPRGSKAQSESVTVQAVLAREDDPPAEAEAIEWMLLTTVLVESVEDALRIVKWYTCRWSIEMFFKVLKSGCATEERQLETAERLKRCLVLDLLVGNRSRGQGVPDCSAHCGCTSRAARRNRESDVRG
jgi:hypothetical protein